MSVMGNDAEMAPGHDVEVNEIDEVDEFYDLYEFEKLDEGSMSEVAEPSPMVVDVADTPRWSGLEKLQVFSATGATVIYANGHQQIKLIVVVRAVNDAFEGVNLSEGEFKNIHLVDAYSRQALEFDYIRDGDPPVWKYSMDKIGDFAPLPYSGEFNGPRTHGPGLFVKAFYVNSNTPSTINLVAAITRSDGKVFYSDEEAPFGRVSLKAIAPAVYARDKFIFKHYANERYDSEVVERLDRYQLHLEAEQHHIKFVSCRLSNLLRARSHPDKHFIDTYVISYLKGQEVFQEYDSYAEKADSVAIEHNEDGKITLLVHVSKKRISDPLMLNDCLSVEMFLQDMYGNKQVLELRIDPADPTRIVLMT